MEGLGDEAPVPSGTVLEEQLSLGRFFFDRHGRCIRLTNHG